MKAKDAARIANEDPSIKADDVIKMMPEYDLELHKNSWISTFFNNIDNPERFDSIRAGIKKYTITLDAWIISASRKRGLTPKQLVNEAVKKYLST